MSRLPVLLLALAALRAACAQPVPASTVHFTNVRVPRGVAATANDGPLLPQFPTWNLGFEVLLGFGRLALGISPSADWRLGSLHRWTAQILPTLLP